MKHKHADLMLEYAKQAQENECPWMNWERSYNGVVWEDLLSTPAWNENIMYRVKKSINNKNEIEIPEPVREALKYGEVYYMPDLRFSNMEAYSVWRGDSIDYYRLSRGIIHRCQYNACKHTEVLLSLTC